MPIVVYERRKLIDHITRIKFGEVNESAGGIMLIYCRSDCQSGKADRRRCISSHYNPMSAPTKARVDLSGGMTING